MKLDELKELLKFQLAETTREEDARTELSVELIDRSNSKVKRTFPIKDIESILPLVEGFVFDAYRADGTAVFIKPETIVAL